HCSASKKTKNLSYHKNNLPKIDQFIDWCQQIQKICTVYFADYIINYLSPFTYYFNGSLDYHRLKHTFGDLYWTKLDTEYTSLFKDYQSKPLIFKLVSYHKNTYNSFHV
ncbi:hypothetical protein GVAV_000727, partial [Gurleya vavrai]